MTENRIKEYRGNRGMTQAELAKLVGVRRETIYNLENGRYNPSLSLAWKIAQVFNTSIEDIFRVIPQITTRLEQIDKVLNKLYEDNALGTIPQDR